MFLSAISVGVIMALAITGIITGIGIFAYRKVSKVTAANRAREANAMQMLLAEIGTPSASSPAARMTTRTDVEESSVSPVGGVAPISVVSPGDAREAEVETQKSDARTSVREDFEAFFGPGAVVDDSDDSTGPSDDRGVRDEVDRVALVTEAGESSSRADGNVDEVGEERSDTRPQVDETYARDYAGPMTAPAIGISTQNNHRNDFEGPISRVIVLNPDTDAALSALLYDLDAALDSGQIQVAPNHREALLALRQAVYGI